MRIESLGLFNPLCESKLVITNRETVRQPVEGLNCKPCMEPIEDELTDCCRNCYTFTLPSLTDGLNIFCDEVEYPDNPNVAPEHEFETFVPYAFPERDYCHSTKSFNYGECLCGGGAQGGVEAHVYQLNMGSTYGIPDPFLGQPRPIFLLTFYWGTCVAGAAYTAFYVSYEEHCATKTFTKAGQYVYGDFYPDPEDTLVNWPDEITLHNGPCAT